MKQAIVRAILLGLGSPDAKLQSLAAEAVDIIDDAERDPLAHTTALESVLTKMSKHLSSRKEIIRSVQRHLAKSYVKQVAEDCKQSAKEDIPRIPVRKNPFAKRRLEYFKKEV